MKTKHIGIDFDNTIVLYDRLFYDYALQQGLIDKGTEKTKSAVRKALIKDQKEETFTEIQGIVYGKLIDKAPIQNGITYGLRTLIQSGYKISIVSHKTKYPILGEKYDLHESATNWLCKNGFFDEAIVGIKENNVHFNATFEDKITKIKNINCDFFIDDLIKVLNHVDEGVKKILFTKSIDKDLFKNKDIILMNSWSQLIEIISNN